MHIIYRLCDKPGKDRPAWFSKRACLRNLLRVFGPEHEYHFLCDTGGRPNPKGPELGTWNMAQAGYDIAKSCRDMDLTYQIVCHDSGSNTASFRFAIDYACKLDGWLYLVEDDFLHRAGAGEVLADMIELAGPGDYLTLYDHPDKYLLTGHGTYPGRPGLGYVEVSHLCHWRTTISTVATFAVSAATLCADREIWEKWSSDDFGRPVDSHAFRELSTVKHHHVWSSIPGFATHCENRYLTPLWDWEKEVSDDG